MSREKILEKLIEESGENIKSFAEKIGIPYTTLYSMLARGVGKAAVDNVIKVCRGLGITVEQLEEMAARIDADRVAESPAEYTIAAHHEGEDWTEEEKEDIEEFKEILRLRRLKRSNKE